MRRNRRIPTVSLLAPTLIGLVLGGCEWGEKEGKKSGEEKTAATAGVVRLSERTQDEIGLKIEKVVSRSGRDTLAASGWLVARPGGEAVVKAPSVGFVLTPDGEKEFQPGARVAADQTLGLLQAVLSPVEQADLVSLKKDADILIAQSLATWKRAEAQLARLKGSEESVSGTRLAELQETSDKARITYVEAQKKLPFLPRSLEENPLRMRPVALPSPIAGQVVKVHVAPRQLVTQGDPLWTVADWSSLWVRVPVFEGDLPRVAQTEAAAVRVPGAQDVCDAVPIQIPQAAEAGRRSIDLFYQIANDKKPLRPGQAVAVSLPLGKQTQQLLLPRSAVVWDGMENTWVYVRTAPDEFHRRRIEIGEPDGRHFVVTRGLQEGDAVVAVGAQTLYGEEFKSEIQGLEEND